MKRLVCATAALLALVSSQVMAKEPQALTWHQPEHGGMIIPASPNHSPYDFNHRAAGSDKSDELGVPYYHGTDEE